MSNVPNIFAHRGRYLLSEFHERNKDIPHHKLSEMLPILHNPVPTPDSPVCIIGAGAAGLYTAMIFEYLGISYQIVDAGAPGRVGGRIYTYHFPNGGPYDYYDVGAMRFPDTPFMKRLFDLARNPKRNLSLKLIPYIMQMVEPPNTILYYNDESINNQEQVTSDDPFHVSNYLQDQNLATPQGVAQRVTQVLKPFRDLFTVQPQNIESAMTELFAATNTFSMRGYMFSPLWNMNPRDINWCETLDKSTGWYDRALTETVIESLAFDWPTAGNEPPKSDPNASWYCFDGGSSTLPQAMFKSLSASAQSSTLFESPVTAISEAANNYMSISINNVPSSQLYSAVISTVPLPRLSLMDLTGVGIAGAGSTANYAQWSAIRELQYGPAVKVGIRFNTPWWETSLPQPIHGGQSYTDLPLRTIVYPSYPANATAPDMSNVLIVSYCWTQDAERLGALIHGDGTADQQLIDVAFRDLAAVHGVTVDWLYTFYTGDYFAWDWLHDPLTMGGYAFFGPGCYSSQDIYCQMLLPAANSRLFFAGEATSSCHAWVSGALDSAWRAVDQYLRVYHPDTLHQKFLDEWGSCEYWDEANNEELVELNNKLTERHLVIALHKSGIRL